MTEAWRRVLKLPKPFQQPPPIRKSKDPASKRSRREAAQKDRTDSQASSSKPEQSSKPRKILKFKSPPTLEYLCPEDLEDDDFEGVDGWFDGGEEECDEDPQASAEPPVVEDFKHLLHQLSADQLDQLWHGREDSTNTASSLQPPSYIAQSQAFTVDQESSLAGGIEYERWISRMGEFSF